MASNKYIIEDFEEGVLLGTGGFAKVYSATLKPDAPNPCGLPSAVAIKKICKNFVKKKGFERRVRSEIDIHKNLNHPNIVKFYTTFEDKSYHYLVLELCKCTLEEYIESFKEDPKYPKKYIDECIVFDIIKEIVAGLVYLHKKPNIMHRDLSLRNILRGHDEKWKITDFGLSIHFTDKGTTNKFLSMVGTPNYQSPEMLANKPYDRNSEFWNLGTLIFRILGGKLPIDENAEKRIHQIDKIGRSPELKELLNHLLINEPSHRWGLDEIVKSPFYLKYSKFNSPDQVKETNKYSRKNGSSNDSGRGSNATTGASSTRHSPQSDRILDSGCGSYNSKSDKNRNNLRNYQQSSELSYLSNHSNSRHGHDFKTSLKPPLEMYKNRIAYKSNKCTTEQSAHHNILKKQYQTLPPRPSPIIPTMPYETNSYPTYTYVRYEDRPTHDTIDPIYPLHPVTNSRERSASEEQRKQERRLLERQLKETNSSEAGRISHHSRDRSRRSRTKSGERTSQHSSSHTSKKSQTKSSERHSSRHRDKYRSSSRTNIQTENNPQYSHHEDNSVTEKPLQLRKIPNEMSTLKPKPQALNTERLQPTRFPIKKTAVVSILNSGEVCVEWLKTKVGRQYITDVVFISSNGKWIETYKPQDCLVGSAPPPKPHDNKQIEKFRYDNLPQTYWKMYRAANFVVNGVRSTTPKITCYKGNLKIQMMENYPDPDFEMEFYSGGNVTQRSNKVTLTDKWGKSINIADVESSESHFTAMRDKFNEMKEWCKDIEAGLEKSKTSGYLPPFSYPVAWGNPPPEKESLSAKDDFKENIALHSSEQTSKNKCSSNSYERQKRHLRNLSNK